MKVKLKDIASVGGKGGLYLILKSGKNGLILESIDEKKKKNVVGRGHQVSVLDEISIYTYTEEGSCPLIEVLRKINIDFGDDPGVDSKSTKEELRAFFKHILPDHDVDKVYHSDIKKIVSWYKILLKYYPDILIKNTDNESLNVDKEASETSKEK